MNPEVLAQVNNVIPPELVAFGLMLTALSGTFFFIWGFVGPVVKWIKKQTYQLSYREIETYVADEDYVKFNLWLNAHQEHTYFQRAFKVVNRSANDEEEVMDANPSHLVAGFGTVIVKVPGLPLISVTRSKVEGKQVYEQTENLKFRIFSIREASVKKFFDSVMVMDAGSGPFVYTPSSWHWSNIGRPKTVLPPISASSREFVEDVGTFLTNRSEYVSRGIAYKRGYLLFGEPGTGKSSDIAYVANKYKMNIYQLNSEGIVKFSDLRRSVKPRSIILVEDVDMTVAGSESRKGIIGDKDSDAEKDKATMEKVLSKEAMREFLNTLDGICEFSGSIIVLTTNKPSTLDSALLRPGRIDKQIEVGAYTTDEQREHINRFFGVDLDVSVFESVTKRTVAETQYLCIQHMNDVDAVIAKL